MQETAANEIDWMARPMEVKERKERPAPLLSGSTPPPCPMMSSSLVAAASDGQITPHLCTHIIPRFTAVGRRCHLMQSILKLGPNLISYVATKHQASPMWT